MAHLRSPVKKIRDIWIEPIPGGRIIPAAKVVKVDGIVFILGKNGKIYCNQVMKRGFYLLSKYSWMVPFLWALHRMGYLTKAEMEEHLAAAEKAQRGYRLRASLQSFHEAVEELGLKITVAQHRRLVKVAAQLSKSLDS
jgi:hypothetical protein